MKRISSLLILCVLSLSGCASLFEGGSQYTMIATIDDQDRNETSCKINNEEGNWSTRPYQNVYIHKDGNPSTIVCENSKQFGKVEVDPDFSYKWLTLNFIMDLCIFSCSIDGYNNAFYTYPDRINVVMHSKP